MRSIRGDRSRSISLVDRLPGMRIIPSLYRNVVRMPRRDRFGGRAANAQSQSPTLDGAPIGGSPQASSRSTRRMILPVVVSGRLDRNAISRGYSWAESRVRT